MEQSLGLESPYDGYIEACELKAKEAHMKNLASLESDLNDHQIWGAAKKRRQRFAGDFHGDGKDDNNSTTNNNNTYGDGDGDLTDDEEGRGNINNGNSTNGDSGINGGLSPSKSQTAGARAVELDMKHVVEERLKVKQENFRKRKELRRLRKLGLAPGMYVYVVCLFKCLFLSFFVIIIEL